MQKTTVELQQLKERFNPVMKDIEHRLKQLEENIGNGSSQQTMQEMKDKIYPVFTDIEKRLIASISNVSFIEENPTTLTTLTERVQILESRVNNMEPSLSTLQSSISSTPLEPPEEHKRREGLSNESSSSVIPARKMPPLIPTSIGALNYAMGELENRLSKRIQALEGQLVQLGTQELPIRQRELETKVERMLTTSDLPSFGLDGHLTIM